MTEVCLPVFLICAVLLLGVSNSETVFTMYLWIYITFWVWSFKPLLLFLVSNFFVFYVMLADQMLVSLKRFRVVTTSTGRNANTGRKGIFVARRRKYYCITLQYNFYNPSEQCKHSLPFGWCFLLFYVILCSYLVQWPNSSILYGSDDDTWC